MTQRQPETRAQPDTISDEVLAVDGISVRLSGREVLNDVRFSLRRGQFAGLIGSNGAGKTTLLRVILGLTAPTAGEVRIGGRSRRQARGRGLRPAEDTARPGHAATRP